MHEKDNDAQESAEKKAEELLKKSGEAKQRSDKLLAEAKDARRKATVELPASIPTLEKEIEVAKEKDSQMSWIPFSGSKQAVQEAEKKLQAAHDEIKALGVFAAEAEDSAAREKKQSEQLAREAQDVKNEAFWGSLWGSNRPKSEEKGSQSKKDSGGFFDL
mmetsp:Transcript_43116/g.67539  ORF Transcript_43116/g.67539 Transcript_43116/m.67539 type:complete len:161 (-) Transcript_43116:244-726(-)|eukprot:CAMPEP_0184319564 /NCGR_PEP_ID=MMETSP1049-20130417/109216_1 /TAXON_ID=77928 /ORGANISM="Proteomonas sulcata, Strain CCMP704" /LENGTH=160 /DNA_ID=CAMNT_0026639739 /DNA_START=42 /DNA_END=524 /DNA_ORIENTATION=+